MQLLFQVSGSVWLHIVLADDFLLIEPQAPNLHYAQTFIPNIERRRNHATTGMKPEDQITKLNFSLLLPALAFGLKSALGF